MPFLLTLLLTKAIPNISIQVSEPTVKVLVDYLLLTGYNDDRFVLGIFTSRFTDIS